MDEMLVLACSKKWGGRCVAGISKRTGRWLRPVSDRSHGELGARYYRVGGRDIEPLDIVRLEYGEGLDDPSQPENVEVAASRWKLIGTVDPGRAADVLEPYLVGGPVLLENRGAAVPEDEAMLGVEASLALVRPERLEFCLEPPWPGKNRPRPRADFKLDGQGYDLALTDYLVAPRLIAAGLGSHSLADLGFDDGSDVLLTISLAEPRDEWCTKLVAAVLLLRQGR
jgi:Dual OB-containing domain